MRAKAPAARDGRNLFDLKPVRNLEWEEGDLIVLRVPKFRGRILGTWLTQHLPRPAFHVKLDAIGSFVWRNCDGGLTVFEIAERAQGEFPAEHDMPGRVAKFVSRLARDRFLTLRDAGEPSDAQNP